MIANKRLDPAWAESYLAQREAEMSTEKDTEERKQIMHAMRVMTMQILLKQAKE